MGTWVWMTEARQRKKDRETTDGKGSLAIFTVVVCILVIDFKFATASTRQKLTLFVHGLWQGNYQP
jgi:hypothetical protein